MPEIIVTADRDNAQADGPVLMRERVSIADFESDHFTALLMERLGWALSDAYDVERDIAPPED